ncbi:hypothetical protein [Mesorhizobium sp. M1406]|uniref:hypothetical protein n=1 Tax=Mesorhizobium sp. M1406 TaxID=2957099 RepID=UPI00333CFDD1
MDLQFAWPQSYSDVALISLSLAPPLILARRQSYALFGLLANGAIALLFLSSALELVTTVLFLLSANMVSGTFCLAATTGKASHLQNDLASAESTIQDLHLAEERRRAASARVDMMAAPSSLLPRPQPGRQRALKLAAAAGRESRAGSRAGSAL